MKQILIIIAAIFACLYIFCPELVVVDQNKLDTLYMVSTIFFSAVIGMVISNSVHLRYASNKESIRGLNDRMRNVLTFCFAVETIAYFFYDEKHSHLFGGLHLHLIVLALVVLSTVLYISAMPYISHKIADIEDTDYEQQEENEISSEVQDKINRLLDYCQEPRTDKEIFMHLQLKGTSEDYDTYIQSQEEAKRIFHLFLGTQHAYCVKTYLTEKIVALCQDHEQTIRNISKELQISSKTAVDITYELIRAKRLTELPTKEGKRYRLYDKGDLVESSRILGLCKNKAYTWSRILKILNCPQTQENYEKFIKPLIDDGSLIVESVSGDNQYLRNKRYADKDKENKS